MKAEIISSTVVRVSGVPSTRAILQALEPYSKGNLRWELKPATLMEIAVLRDLVPPALLRMAARVPPTHDCPVDDKIGAALWQHLLPHQREGVQRIVHQYLGRCLLADEMGLGKTLQAAAVVKYYSVPTLVVCPSFLRTSWTRTLQQWSVEATVCSYGTVPVDGTFDMVVVDEAHYIKSRDALRTRALVPLLHVASRVLLMTGTPCPNRPEELFVMLHALRPMLVPDFHSFAERYCNPRRTAFCAYDTRGSDRQDELRWLLDRAYIVRRAKGDVDISLPSKQQEVLCVEADPAYLPELQALRGKLDAALERGSKLAQTLIMDMYRATARAKRSSAVQLVASMIDGPTLIFAHHRDMLDAMEAALGTEGVGRIDGSMSTVQRQRVVDSLQSGELRVVVLSMGAAGVGLTLTGACTAFFLEIPWNPVVLAQSEDRLHRIGQDHDCRVYYILGDDTLDSYVWRTIHRKERVAARLGL